MHRLLDQKEKNLFTFPIFFLALYFFFLKKGNKRCGQKVVKTESQASQTYGNTVSMFLALLYDKLKPIIFPSYNLEQNCRDQSRLLVKN